MELVVSGEGSLGALEVGFGDGSETPEVVFEEELLGSLDVVFAGGSDLSEAISAGSLDVDPDFISCFACVDPPEYPEAVVAPGNSPWPPAPSGYFIPPADPLSSFEVSCHAAFASRSSLSSAGASVVAAEVSVLARVEELPLTARGSLSRFALKAPPARVDSAARESEATGPAPSVVEAWVAGSVVF